MELVVIPSLILLALGAGLGRAALWPVTQEMERRHMAKVAAEVRAKYLDGDRG